MRSSFNSFFINNNYFRFLKILANLSFFVTIGMCIIICNCVHNINCFPYNPSSTELDLSFKRLESGENSEEVINQCCSRELKFVTIGYGLDSEELRVDVGYCRQSCETAKIKPLKREEFDKFLKKYPDIDPIQIFLSLQHRHQQQPSHQNNNNNHVVNLSSSTTNDNNNNTNGDSLMLFPINPNVSDNKIFKFTSKSSTASCTLSKCQPTLLKREKHFLLSGLQRTIDVIDTCDCMIPPQQCQRTALQVKIHPGTPYEKIVDIGQCLGTCPASAAAAGATGSHHHHHHHNNGHSSSCKSIRNQTITVDGPNGQECVETIQECQCVGECYRTREFLKVYDYTITISNDDEAEEKKNLGSKDDDDDDKESQNSSSGEVQLLKEPIVKIIDIGRCEGTCLKTQVTSKCLLWSETNSTCLSSLYGGQNQCIPTKFMTHTYTDKDNTRHHIFSVLSCGCR